MKIKIGFVTNSYSTSYCMWCVYQTTDSFPEKLKKLIYDNYIKIYDKKLSYENFLINIQAHPSRFRGSATNIFHEFGLGYAIKYNEYYIGEHLENMEDDETLREFKNKIIEKLKQLDIDRGLQFMIFEMEDQEYNESDYEDEEEYEVED